MCRFISTKQIYIVIVYILIMMISVFVNTPASYTIGTLICWGIGIGFSLKKLKNRFCMFSFNFGYAIFLLGGYVVYWITEHNFNFFNNSNETIIHTCACLMFSIAFFNMCSIVFRKQSMECDFEAKDSLMASNIMKKYGGVYNLVVWLLIITFICELLEEIATTSIIKSTSYAVSDFVNTGLPTIIESLASYYYIVLFIFWGFYPSKKKTLISFVSLALIEVVILISGERGEPISLLFATIFYILMRNRNGIKDIVISKKMIIVGVIMVPFLISMLQTLSYTRMGRSYDVTFVTSIKDFFASQGGSVKIIANGYDLKDRITEVGGNTFVFGTIRDYFQNNIFTRILLGTTRSARTVADAYSGNSYLATYGFLHAAVTYKKGAGAGSTYIAEVFQDGGYIFLVIFNIFLAWLILKIDSSKTISVLKVAIIINIFRYMVLLPRGVALQWLTSTFAIQNIILFLIIIFLQQMSVKKKNKSV